MTYFVFYEDTLPQIADRCVLIHKSQRDLSQELVSGDCCMGRIDNEFLKT
jgi:hypothetical protein